MYLNRYSLRIPEGKERTSGYVEIDHGTQYTLVLKNDRDVDCDAEVKIDGKCIGEFRIEANKSIRLERPVNSDGKFTFYRSGSREAKKARLGNVSQRDLGLISVTFKPEIKIEEVVPVPGTRYYNNPYIDCTYYGSTTTCVDGSFSTTACNYNSGGTGLSGHSGQGFGYARGINIDYSDITTINIRLVERDEDDIRQLHSCRSTPIPPPVE